MVYYFDPVSLELGNMCSKYVQSMFKVMFKVWIGMDWQTAAEHLAQIETKTIVPANI